MTTQSKVMFAGFLATMQLTNPQIVMTIESDAKMKAAIFHIAGNTIQIAAHAIIATPSAATKSTTGEANIGPRLRSIRASDDTFRSA